MMIVALVLVVAVALIAAGLFNKAIADLRREVADLRSERETLEAVATALLDGYDPDLDLNAWVKVLWSHGGDHEREGARMTLAELEVVERLKPKSGT